jgi:UDP-N-acetylmuramoyl-tripeptide--D-alanyl-D-alanine ligase
LRGDRFDGHVFLEEAARKGAVVLIVDETYAAGHANGISAQLGGVAILVVSDTLRAYMALAGSVRDRFTGQVIAITGSAGKTTTKELLVQLLATSFGERAVATPANENNQIGVCTFLLANARDAHDVLVVELGARHPGDVAALVDVVKPDIGILTNIGEAHVEIMGSREALVETKWGLFARGARAILNARDEHSLHRAPTLRDAPHWFTATNGERISIGGRATLVLGRDRLLEIDDLESRERAIDVHLPGLHNRANLAAAIAGADEVGVPLDAIVNVLPSLRLPSGRYEEIVIPGKPRVIYDAYNANASGTIAALDTFAEEAGARHIVVLSSMAELGNEADVLHAEVGERAAKSQPAFLLVGGAHAEALADGARRGGLSAERIVRFATNEEAAQWLRERAHQEDVVLLKGSRVYALEEIVESLRRS